MNLEIGMRVRLRALGGNEIVRRVVGQDKNTVHICSEREYQLSRAEGRRPECIGFPKADIIRVEKGEDGNQPVS